MDRKDKVVSLLDSENYGIEKIVSLEVLENDYSYEYKWLVFFGKGDGCVLIDYDVNKESSTLYEILYNSLSVTSKNEITNIIETLERVYDFISKDSFFIIATKTREDAEFFIKDFKCWNRNSRRPDR